MNYQHPVRKESNMDIIISLILNVPVTLGLIVLVLAFFNKVYTILDQIEIDR